MHVSTKNGLGRLYKRRVAQEGRTRIDVFITGDRNLTFQQAPENFDIAVVVLHAESIQLKHTQPLMQRVAELLPTIKPGEIVDVHLSH